MKLVVTGSIKIECSKCGTKNIVDVEEFDYDAVTSEERSMGPEVGYSASHDIDCSKCKNHISIESNIYEYPAGAVNDDPNDDSYIEIEGGKKISSDINASFEDPFYNN